MNRTYEMAYKSTQGTMTKGCILLMTIFVDVCIVIFCLYF